VPASRKHAAEVAVLRGLWPGCPGPLQDWAVSAAGFLLTGLRRGPARGRRTGRDLRQDW
jgi:hypothetical protein